jgi:hypothetical protein
MAGVFPDFPIPGIPYDPSQPTQDKCCVWQIHKGVDGDRPLTEERHYECDNVPTERGTFTLNWVLLDFSPPDPCDQQTLIKNQYLLSANGVYVKRLRGVGIYSGTFQIRPGPGAHPLFSGRLELYEPIGTHHQPVTMPTGQCDESCSAHIEGWLVGQGDPNGPHPDYALHAEIAANPITPNTPRTQGVLNGVLIQCTMSAPPP